LLADVLVFNREGSAFCHVLVQRLETLLFVLQVFRSSDEFLHCFDIEKLVDIVVVSKEIRWDFPRHFELAVFSNHSLDLFYESVFGVIAGDVEGAVVRVLKFPSIGELYDPRGDCDGAVRGGLIESDLQENSILETSD